jgi:hypothetical protein
VSTHRPPVGPAAVHPTGVSPLAWYERRGSSPATQLSISADAGRDVPASADDEGIRSASCNARQFGRFVKVHRPVLHRRPQRGMRSLYGRPRGRTPIIRAAYANKSPQELCRNCVRRTRKPQRTGTNTASHRRARDGRNPLIRLCCGAPMSPGAARRKHIPSVLLQPLGQLSVFRINNLRAVAH